MAFTQFPNQQYFRVLESDTITKLGYFNLDDGTELKHIMLTIFQKGIISSAYQMRLKLYPTVTSSSAIITSSWATISTSTLVPTYASNWLGTIYVDFAGEPLNPNLDYFVSVETLGYTRLTDSYYVGINLDWYSPVNTALSSTEAGARMRILGNR
jgi:hypothetical protein